MAEDILRKRAYIAALFDIYKPLLTAKQCETMRLCYEEDCSLSEIAEICGVSKQAAGDILQRTLAVMERYERALALLAERQGRAAALAKLKSLLDEASLTDAQRREAGLLLALLE